MGGAQWLDRWGSLRNAYRLLGNYPKSMLFPSVGKIFVHKVTSKVLLTSKISNHKCPIFSQYGKRVPYN